jgi:hypothetical protein
MSRERTNSVDIDVKSKRVLDDVITESAHHCAYSVASWAGGRRTIQTTAELVVGDVGRRKRRVTRSVATRNGCM